MVDVTTEHQTAETRADPLELREEAIAFWQGRCPDCAHPEHEMTCHELVQNGDPSNGPAYCPCASKIELMEQEIVRLRGLVTCSTCEPLVIHANACSTWLRSDIRSALTPGAPDHE